MIIYITLLHMLYIKLEASESASVWADHHDKKSVLVSAAKILIGASLAASHKPQFSFIVNNSSNMCIENCLLIKPANNKSTCDNT